MAVVSANQLSLEKTLEELIKEFNALRSDVTSVTLESLVAAASAQIVFEGATDDANETTLTTVDPTADRTITLPDATGTVVTTGNADVGATTTTFADLDHFLINDGGTLKKMALSTALSSLPALIPSSANANAIGSASLEWSDLFLGDGSVINFGNDQDVTLTHVADTGLLLNSTMALQFNDASQFINAPSATVLDINATDEIELNATIVDLNGDLDVSGNALITGVTTHGGNVVSDTDSTDDLGTTSVRWANTWTDTINGVTAPTAQYTSAEETKLAGIEASADVTDSTNVLAGLVGQEAVATGFTGTLDGVLGSGTPAAATVTTIDASGVATATTFEPDGDTSAGDNAAMGYTSVLGAILTGQGSTNDVTLVNDADATVLSIPTGTTNVAITGDITANNFAGRNRIINGDFAIWQRGTSFSPGANLQVYTADRFFMNRNGVSEWTVSRQGTNEQYSCRVQRNASTTSTQAMRVRQVLESANCGGIVGETVTFSCEIKVGANFSAASGYVTLTIAQGSGNDETGTKMATGFTGVVTTSSNTVPTTSWAKYSVTSGVIGSTISQLGVLIEATPVGTAGANDWYEVRNIQLEVGATATEFEVRSVGNTLDLCKRYYQFAGGDTAYQNIVVAAYYGTGDAVGTYRHHPSLRAAPTVAKSGSWSVLGGAGAVSQTVSGDQNGPNSIQLGFTGGSSGVSGQATTIRVSNDLNFRLSFDAEL